MDVGKVDETNGEEQCQKDIRKPPQMTLYNKWGKRGKKKGKIKNVQCWATVEIAFQTFPFERLWSTRTGIYGTCHKRMIDLNRRVSKARRKSGEMTIQPVKP